jgi:hypothetical protein
VAADFESLIEQIKSLPREQKFQLVKRLEQDGFFDDQSWYWTPEWQAAEKEADDDIATGRVHRFGNVEDAVGFLHREAGDKPE